MDLTQMTMDQVTGLSDEELDDLHDRAAHNAIIIENRNVISDGAHRIARHLRSLHQAADDVADPYEAGSAEEYIAMNYKRESLIALRVQGESMNRLAQDGSIIIVDYEDRELVSGKLYVFKTDDGEAAFKRYRSDPVRFEPVSTEEHETLFPTGEWFVVGRVVEVRNKT